MKKKPKKSKCPSCLNMTGMVNWKDYCEKCALKLLSSGKIGRIDFPREGGK